MSATARSRAVVTTVTALLAVLALAVPLPARAADEHDAFEPGRASASGAVLQARVFYAGLSLPVPIGLSASDYERGQSRALGAAVSASAAGGLTGVAIDGTAPVSIDSNAGDTSLETSLDGDPRLVGSISLSATQAPASRSVVRLADLDLPGLLRVEGGLAQSSTGVSDEQQRVAEASVELAAVVVADGLVELRGLRWLASHRTGPDASVEAETDASFSLDSLHLGGVPVPLDVLGGQLGDVLGLVNGVLAPVGLSVTAPTVEQLADGSIDIGPLRVTLANSPLGVQLLGPLLATVRPMLLPVTDAVVSAAPPLGIANLLLDLGLGVADGTGGAELAVGGANAGTDATVFDDPLATDPAPATTPAPAAPEPGAGPVLAAPAVPVLPSPVAPAPSPARVASSAEVGPARCVLAADPRRRGDCRGANEALAAGVIAIGLAALALNEVRVRRRRVAPPTVNAGVLA